MKIKIKYKSVLKDFKNVKERNYAFNNLDKQSQRLEIAWDALNLIINDNVTPADGYYWGNELRRKLELLNPKETQVFLLKELNKDICKVCQRGLMMVSQIRLGNELSSSKSKNIYEGDDDNIKGFSLKDFTRIEGEYECSDNSHPYFSHSKEKLANICCNILVNGNFNKKDKTDYLIKSTI